MPPRTTGASTNRSRSREYGISRETVYAYLRPTVVTS